jgi:hypothetical protein
VRPSALLPAHVRGHRLQHNPISAPLNSLADRVSQTHVPSPPRHALLLSISPTVDTYILNSPPQKPTAACPQCAAPTAPVSRPSHRPADRLRPRFSSHILQPSTQPPPVACPKMTSSSPRFLIVHAARPMSPPTISQCRRHAREAPLHTRRRGSDRLARTPQS